MVASTAGLIAMDGRCSDATPDTVIGELPVKLRDLLLKVEPMLFSALSPALKSGKARVQRSLAAQKYLRGSGVEIGAFVQTIMTPKGSATVYVDQHPASYWRDTSYRDLDIVDPDVIDDAKHLHAIPDARFDYLAAAHVLEHIDDPIEAMRNWLRVVKPGGYLLIAVPDKRFTPDRQRALTSFGHLLRDHIEGPQASVKEDHRDFGYHHLGITDEAALQEYVDRNQSDIHFHTWTLTSFLHFLAELNDYFGGNAFEVVEAQLNVNEALCVLRRSEHAT